jgi:glycerate 2-kinase
MGLDAQARLDMNDSTPFWRAVGGLIETGPTLTNANDLRAIMVTP